MNKSSYLFRFTQPIRTKSLCFQQSCISRQISNASSRQIASSFVIRLVASFVIRLVASSFVIRLVASSFVVRLVASSFVIMLVKVKFLARSIDLENAKFCSYFFESCRFRHSAHISRTRAT